MKVIQIRNVPDETHGILQGRAAAAGQSLQEYLLSELNELASQPTLAELLERVEQRSGGHSTIAGAVATLRSDRDAH